jgi:hypothetical protein
MRGVGLATRFFARVDGSCSPVRLRRGHCSSYRYGGASRQAPQCPVVGAIFADPGGCGASVGGGSPIYDGSTEYHHARHPEEPPNSQRPRGPVPVSGGLDTLAREAVKCWKCGMPDHFARDCPNAQDCPKHWQDCPKDAGADVHHGAPLQMLSVQEVLQEPHTLIASFQTQVSLQQQLLAEQTTLARQDQLLSRVGAALPQGAGMPLAVLMAPPAVAQATMILGGDQPEGYVYIGTNQGLTVWGHANIVQASLTDSYGASLQTSCGRRRRNPTLMMMMMSFICSCRNKK